MLDPIFLLIGGTLVVGGIVIWLVDKFTTPNMNGKPEVVQPNGDPVPEGGPPVEYRDEEEHEAALSFRAALWEDEYHIKEAVELGAEHGLSKRRAREFIDAWTEAGEVAEEYRNEPGPGRPKRYIGGIGPGG